MSVESEPTVSRSNHDQLLIEATVGYWWQKRRLIAVTMLLFIAVFSGILMLIPRAYRAQASIIIMPPRFMPEIRTEPLTILSAQSLLQTNELYQQVSRTLRRYRNVLVRHAGTQQLSADDIDRLSRLSAAEIAGGGAQVSVEEAEAIAELDPTEISGIMEFTDEELAELSVDLLGQILSSSESVEKRTASDIVHSPVLQLFAVSDSGNKAQVLVNLWAKLFEEKYESLTRGQTQKLYESLEKQQDAGQEELENIQKVLVDFSLLNNLELIQRQITEHSNSYTSLNRSLVTKSMELANLEGKVASVSNLLDSLEAKDSSWIGSLRVVNDTDGEEETTYVGADPEPVESQNSTIVRRRGEALASRENLRTAYESAREFNIKNPIQLLESELQQLEEEYQKSKIEYRSSFMKAEVARKTLSELNSAVLETSQSVSLLTSLPDEVVGETLAANRVGEAARVASIYLNKEQLNPLWETLVRQRAEVSKVLFEAEATVAGLKSDIPVQEEKLRTLNEQIFEAQQAEKLVNRRIEHADEINQQLFKNYTAMKEQVFELGWEKTMLQGEVKALENAAASSLETIEALRASYEAASAEMEILELRKKAALQRAQLVTEKLQESMVAVREEVSDVSLASRAVAPTRHVFPPRTILLAVLTLLAASILLGGLSRKRYRELASE